MKILKHFVFIYIIFFTQTFAQVQNFISTTSNAAGNSPGAIYTDKTDGTNNEVLYNFAAPPDGSHPSGSFVEGSDGNFYTMCTSGGTYSGGTIVKITPGGVLTKLKDFSLGIDGSSPNGSLTKGSDGNFYGMCSQGGANYCGTIFKITSSGVFTKLRDLSTTDGVNPMGSLVQATDGDFYGMCNYGGINNVGTIFKMTPAGVLTKLRDLATTDGANPRGSLIQATDGNFYGMCSQGGANSGGTIFKITSVGGFTKLKDLSTTTGINPYADLLQNTDGDFYGACSSGGAYNGGTIFKITSGGTFTNLRDLDPVPDGSSPSGNLAKGNDGNLYSMCNWGNILGTYVGSIFKISTSGVFTKIWDFRPYYDGAVPGGSLLLGSDGNFYGTCNQSGLYAQGTFFKITSSGVFTIIKNLSPALDGDGVSGNLTRGNDGDFYGICRIGGTNNYGTFFKISLTGTFTKLMDFTNTITGIQPNGGLALGDDGNFYGTCYLGGTNGQGTIFKITPAGVMTKLRDLSFSDGGSPYTGVIKGADGNFYGMCYAWGGNSYGTIYKITPGGTFTKLKDLANNTDGGNPQGKLTLGSDGNFYGMCTSGGANSVGTIFKITSVGGFTKLKDLSSSEGSYPLDNLVEGSNGNFYGNCYSGGTEGAGTTFKITPTGTLTKLKDFSYVTDGGIPRNLALGKDNNLYGMCQRGGSYYVGMSFKITPGGVFSKVNDVSYTNGGFSTGSIVLYDGVSQTITGFNPIPAQAFENSRYTITGVAAGSALPVTFMSSNPSVATVNAQTITFLSAGVTTITAYQKGNSVYAAAQPVSRILTVLSCAGFLVPEVTLAASTSAAVCPNTTISFTATGINTGLNPTYSLLKNGTFVSSSTGTVFSSAVLKNDNIKIKLNINQAGCFTTTTALSNIYVANVNSATSIVAQPESKSVTVHNPVQFVISAVGTNLTYQWTNNSGFLSGATLPVFTLPGLSRDADNYQVIVTGACGVVVSNTAVLTVNKLPQSIVGFNFNPSQNIDDEFMTVSGTATSGLPVVFSSSELSVATVDGNAIRFLASGITTITAFQAGNDDYNPVSVSKVLVINESPLNIVFKGNENAWNSEFEIYPNPSGGTFVLEFNEIFEGKKECQVYNSQGSYIKTIYSGEATLPQGLYLLRSGKGFKKLVIE